MSVLIDGWKKSSLELPVIKDEDVKMAHNKLMELIDHFLGTVGKNDVIEMIENQENDDEKIPLPL